MRVIERGVETAIDLQGMCALKHDSGTSITDAEATQDASKRDKRRVEKRVQIRMNTVRRVTHLFKKVGCFTVNSLTKPSLFLKFQLTEKAMLVSCFVFGCSRWLRRQLSINCLLASYKSVSNSVCSIR